MAHLKVATAILFAPRLGLKSVLVDEQAWSRNIWTHAGAQQSRDFFWLIRQLWKRKEEIKPRPSWAITQAARASGVPAVGMKAGRGRVKKQQIPCAD